MNTKITVELTPKQAVILTRLTCTSSNSYAELINTAQGQYIQGLPQNKISDYSSRLTIKAQNLTDIFNIINAAAAKQGINFRKYEDVIPIKIDNREVEHKSDGIQVGCQFVSNETLREIAKRQGIIS